MQRVSRGHEHDCLALQRIHNRVVEIDLVYDWYDFRQLRAAGRSIVSPVDYSLSVLHPGSQFRGWEAAKTHQVLCESVVFERAICILRKQDLGQPSCCVLIRPIANDDRGSSSNAIY